MCLHAGFPLRREDRPGTCGGRGRQCGVRVVSATGPSHPTALPAAARPRVQAFSRCLLLGQELKIVFGGTRNASFSDGRGRFASACPRGLRRAGRFVHTLLLGRHGPFTTAGRARSQWQSAVSGVRPVPGAPVCVASSPSPRKPAAVAAVRRGPEARLRSSPKSHGGTVAALAGPLRAPAPPEVSPPLHRDAPDTPQGLMSLDPPHSQFAGQWHPLAGMWTQIWGSFSVSQPGPRTFIANRSLCRDYGEPPLGEARVLVTGRGQSSTAVTRRRQGASPPQGPPRPRRGPPASPKPCAFITCAGRGGGLPLPSVRWGGS